MNMAGKMLQVIGGCLGWVFFIIFIRVKRGTCEKGEIAER